MIGYENLDLLRRNIYFVDLLNLVNLGTAYGVQKMWSYRPSTINPAALHTCALSVMTWTTFCDPTLSIASIIILEMNVASFSTPLQSIAFKNIAPWGHIAITLIKGWFLWSLHPSETLDTPVSAHVSRIDCNYLSTVCLSNVSNVVQTFSYSGDLYPFGASLTALIICCQYGDHTKLNASPFA